MHATAAGTMSGTLIDAETLAARLDDPALLVVDCRFSLADPEAGESAYAESRVPGARYAHLERDLSGATVPGVTGRHPLPERDALEATLRGLGLAVGGELVAYDDAGGAIAARLWWLALWLGHARVAVLDGGFKAWRAAGLPLERGAPRAPARAAGNFVAGPARVASVGIETVEAMVARAAAVGADTGVGAGGNDGLPGSAPRLLDARERARFRGEHEPIDPVAGHIPGALNHPFTDNLDADGRFLPRAELAARFAATLGAGADGSDAAPPVVHYCGSGVTAAHNVLAMTHAGLDPGALYVGSFSEWITRHPVASGDATA